jgi:hypothetical protein
MKQFILLFVITISCQINAQELFVMTEPASNMAAGSVGVRLANSLMKEQESSGYNYHLIPEFMWGTNKNLMFHSSLFLSDKSNNLVAEGGSIYGKYRFLSVDDFHSHFRMAGYARYSFNNASIHQDEINLIGHNSGYQIGIVATQLIHKVAISGNLSYLNAIDNLNNNSFPDNQSNKAIDYSLSFGKLMYPKKYTTFKQTNINVMVEIEGQKLIDDNKFFLDIAPSIQLIINSQARIDFAYIKQLYSNMERTAPNGVYIKFEYTFFDLKK